MHSSGSCQGLFLYGTGVCGMATAPGARKPISQQNIFSKNFWYKINAKETWGGEQWRPGQPPFPDLRSWQCSQGHS